MKRSVAVKPFIAVAVFLIGGCALQVGRQPYIEPNLEHVPELERAVSKGWPFRVVASVGDYDGPPKFVETIRSEFLEELAEASFADRIKVVTIDARFPIYESWKCRIDRSDGKPPIQLGEDIPFFRGGPHPYRQAVRAVNAAFR